MIAFPEFDSFLDGEWRPWIEENWGEEKFEDLLCSPRFKQVSDTNDIEKAVDQYIAEHPLFDNGGDFLFSIEFEDNVAQVRISFEEERLISTPLDVRREFSFSKKVYFYHLLLEKGVRNGLKNVKDEFLKANSQEVIDFIINKSTSLLRYYLLEINKKQEGASWILALELDSNEEGKLTKVKNEIRSILEVAKLLITDLLVELERTYKLGDNIQSHNRELITENLSNDNSGISTEYWNRYQLIKEVLAWIIEEKKDKEDINLVRLIHKVRQDLFFLHQDLAIPIKTRKKLFSNLVNGIHDLENAFFVLFWNPTDIQIPLPLVRTATNFLKRLDDLEILHQQIIKALGDKLDEFYLEKEKLAWIDHHLSKLDFLGYNHQSDVEGELLQSFPRISKRFLELQRESLFKTGTKDQLASKGLQKKILFEYNTHHIALLFRILHDAKFLSSNNKVSNYSRLASAFFQSVGQETEITEAYFRNKYYDTDPGVLDKLQEIFYLLGNKAKEMKEK